MPGDSVVRDLSIADRRASDRSQTWAVSPSRGFPLQRWCEHRQTGDSDGEPDPWRCRFLGGRLISLTDRVGGDCREVGGRRGATSRRFTRLEQVLVEPHVEVEASPGPQTFSRSFGEAQGVVAEVVSPASLVEVARADSTRCGTTTVRADQCCPVGDRLVAQLLREAGWDQLGRSALVCEGCHQERRISGLGAGRVEDDMADSTDYQGDGAED
jgi:hypothetical protein